jgi:hypothetical protein
MAKSKKDKASDSFDRMTNFDEYESGMASITNELGKQDIMYQKIAKNMDISKGIINSIASTLKNNNDLTGAQKNTIEKSVEAYKEQSAAIAKGAIALKKKKITQKEYNDLVIKGNEAYQDLTKSISESGKSIKTILPTLRAMGEGMDEFGKAAQKSQNALDGINGTLDQIGGSGVQGVRELGEVFKSAANGGKGLSLAIGALAGVAAGMAYNFGLVGNKLGTIAGYDKKITELGGQIDTINKQVDMGMFGGRNFVLEEAMLGFSESVAQMGNQFQAASKTALFGNKLGSVGYGASQLQMAGISAENIAEAMQNASDATGKMPSGKVAADMSIMAQRTGQSTESIAIINETFQRLDKVSEKTALNLQEGVRAMADKAGVNLGSAMAEIAEASKDALSYQIKGSSQLAKQVIAAKSLGVSFNEIAKAGQNMVLNYKDSIKAEMSLSAMLGKNVDLSEVRAKFMEGDQEGAMAALKAQGLNPKDMNMFQQQQLQQALGGMDLNSIQKISENTGRSGGNLGEASAEAGNKTFLAAKQSAEAGLAAANAMTSAAFELQKIALNSEQEQQRQQAIIDNVAGLADKMNQRDQQGFLKNAETMLTTALISTIATVVTTFLMNKGMGLFKGGAKMPTASPKVTTPTGPTAKTAQPRGADGRFMAKPSKGTSVAGDVVSTAAKTTTKTAGKTAAKTAGKAGLKTAAKVGGKAILKSAVKKIPIIGALAGIGFALQRAASGDFAGAALEVASGAAGTIPGIGTTASIGIDAILAAKDMGVIDSASTASKPTAAAAKPVSKEQQAKPIEVGTKSTVAAVNAMGQKQIDAQKIAAEKAKVTLTEAQYSTKLQQETVAMLGLSTQILNKIMENTANGGDITLNGRTLTQSLLNQSRRNYGVARTA